MTKKTLRISESKKVRLTIEVPRDIRQKLKSQVALDGISMTKALIKIIEAYGDEKFKLNEI